MMWSMCKLFTFYSLISHCFSLFYNILPDLKILVRLGMECESLYHYITWLHNITVKINQKWSIHHTQTQRTKGTHGTSNRITNNRKNHPGFHFKIPTFSFRISLQLKTYTWQKELTAWFKIQNFLGLSPSFWRIENMKWDLAQVLFLLSVKVVSCE